MSEPRTSTVDIKVSDGSQMRAFVAKPAKADKAPGVMVLQEAFGVNTHIRDVAMRLANEGYMAVAPELFHRTATPGWHGSYDDFNTIMPHIKSVAKNTLEADLKATYEWLRNEPEANPEKIGCIGFCMGGRAAFLANGTLPLRAAISFYGGGIATDFIAYAATQHAPILLCWGGLDKHIGVEQQRTVADALRAKNKPFVDVEFSDADHGFLCDERKSFNKHAAAQGWALSVAFLKQYLYP